MSKNFNLSIPKKRLRTARFKWGKYFSSTALSGAALSLVLAGALILPQTAQAEDENVDNDPPGCIIERGTITTSPQSATFADGSTDTDIDFKITCTGALHARLDFESIKELFEDRAAEKKTDGTTDAYDPEESITMIDLSAVTGNGLSFALDPATAILDGMLTNGASITDGAAVAVYTEDYDDTHAIVAENRATILVQGDGRRAITAYRHERQAGGGDVTLKNFGSLTTEGDPCDRSDSDGACYTTNPERLMYPYRRATGIQAGIDNAGATGNVMVTNEADATVHVKGDGARGIEAYNSGEGNTEVENSGSVTTEGDLWEPEADASYSPRGISAWANSGGATATNKAGGMVTTGVEGDPTKGQRGYGVGAFTGDDGVATSGRAKAVNEGTITTHGHRAHALRASTYATVPGKAEVINEGTGIIITHGNNAHGISAWATSTSGSEVMATGWNKAGGMITTHGENADGIRIFATDNEEEGSMVTATNDGTITVNGDSDGDNNHTNGIVAGFWMEQREAPYSGKALGTVNVVNSGTVTATGENASAIAAGFWAAQGNTIENSGNVDINIRGGSEVTASGSNSVAVIAETHGSGNVDIDIDVDTAGRTPRDSSSTITITAGEFDNQGDFDSMNDIKNFGYGISATANTDSSESEDISTDNDVDITIEGEIVDGAHSITIQAYGAATDDDSTDIDETKGIAIYADSGDMVKGRSNISIKNAHVAGGENGSGHAVVFAGGGGILTVDNSLLEGNVLFSDADDKLYIEDSAGSCSDGSNDDCAQFTVRDSGGIHFGGGNDVMRIRANHFTMDGIDITGSPTINFSGHPTRSNLPRTLTLRDVRFDVTSINIRGDIDDTLTLSAADRSSSINGDIDFGAGEDTLNINVGDRMTFDLMGEITNLETMNKQGDGIARVNNVVFTGSELNVEDGKLIVSGHLNLGVDGTLTVKKVGKLVFEVEGTGDGEYGQVTAGDLVFEPRDDLSKMAEVFVQLSNNLDADQVDTVHAALTDLEDGLNVLLVTRVDTGDSGSTVLVKSESTGDTPTMETVGSITVAGDSSPGAVVFTDAAAVAMIEKTGVDAVEPDDPPSMGMMSGSSGNGSGNGTTGGGSTPTTPIPSASSGSSSSSGGGAILGLGLLAVLLNSFVGDDDASASFGDYYFNTPQSAYIASINERGVMTIKETGNQPYQMWIRTGHTAQPMQMTGVSNTGVSGTEVGFNLYNSDTFYINTSVAPNVAAEVGSLNLAGKGEVYSLNSGWRNDRYFAGMRLSHGEFEVNSIVDNPIVNSALISNAKLRNTQAQLRAGMNLGTGALRFTPSAAVQVGTYESSEHVADSPALEAAIPGYAQDYTSVQLGLKMTSDKWLSFSNGSKWKPQLKFDSIHTDSTDAGSLTLRQSDKAGALSFNTNAGLRSMPEVVNSMSFGAKVKSSTNDQAEWKFGFAGLEADGEEYYAAMAAYQVRF